MNRNIAAIFFVGVMAFASGFPSRAEEPASPAELRKVKQTLPELVSVGEGKGIHPGRVVWSHAPGAVTAPERASDWWRDDYISSTACDSLISQSLIALTGESSPAAAWNALFIYFNKQHRPGEICRGYLPGERIAVKINGNNSYSHADSPEINATPQMVLALIRALVEDAGIAQEDITIAEPSRFITDNIFDLCHARYPRVRFVDNQGGDGRIKAEFVPDRMHYSADNGQLATGIATAFTEADYVINMALLKGHVGQGVTLCGKNWYGAMNINADWRKNFHNNFDQDRDGSPKYMTFVDFMGHPDLGGKTMLYLIDGMLGSRSVSGAPAPKWKGEPFAGNWPCSLFAAQDPVAIDMVALDRLALEFPDAPDMDYSDMYLVEAATAGMAPSELNGVTNSATLYRPGGEGAPVLESLGVAQHCRGTFPPDYSLGSGREGGIELIYRLIGAE